MAQNEQSTEFDWRLFARAIRDSIRSLKAVQHRHDVQIECIRRMESEFRVLEEHIKNQDRIIASQAKKISAIEDEAKVCRSSHAKEETANAKIYTELQGKVTNLATNRSIVVSLVIGITIAIVTMVGNHLLSQARQKKEANVSTETKTSLKGSKGTTIFFHDAYADKAH